MFPLDFMPNESDNKKIIREPARVGILNFKFNAYDG